MGEARILLRDAADLNAAVPSVGDTLSTSTTSAFTRPGCGDSSRMRLPMRIASAIECVTNITVNLVSLQS